MPAKLRTNHDLYQRLEFLGDSVLDLLITWHLYHSHEDVDPGELTDLRSASVNNENFAQVAVRHQLYQHLQHCTGVLLNQIDEYVKYLSFPGKSSNAHHDKKGPKVFSNFLPFLQLLLVNVYTFISFAYYGARTPVGPSGCMLLGKRFFH